MRVQATTLSFPMVSSHSKCCCTLANSTPPTYIAQRGKKDVKIGRLVLATLLFPTVLNMALLPPRNWDVGVEKGG